MIDWRSTCSIVSILDVDLSQGRLSNSSTGKDFGIRYNVRGNTVDCRHTSVERAIPEAMGMFHKLPLQRHNNMLLIQLTPMPFWGSLMLFSLELANTIMYTNLFYISITNRSNTNINNKFSQISTFFFEHIDQIYLFLSIFNDNKLNR